MGQDGVPSGAHWTFSANALPLVEVIQSVDYEAVVPLHVGNIVGLTAASCRPGAVVSSQPLRISLSVSRKQNDHCARIAPVLRRQNLGT
jgi:hypothetical protein